MKRHWNANKTCLEIEEMPFYWRLSTSADAIPDILPRLPISVKEDENFDYLRYAVGDREWSVIDAAYKKNENIGFLNIYQNLR